MQKRRLRAPSPALVISLVALFVALGGTTYAATSLPRNSVGTPQLKNGAVTDQKLKNGAVTAAKIDAAGLTVPHAVHATSADSAASAASATNATHAANADELAGHAAGDFLAATGTAANSSELGGHAAGDFLAATGTAANSSELGGALPAAFQSRVTGTCGANSGIAQIGSAGSVTCANAQFYSGRLVEGLNRGDTVLTIPGVAHVISLNCQAGNANAALINDASGTTDIWTGGDASYVGTNWAESNSTFAPTGGATWHLGKGSGPGATAVTVTVSTEATGSNCVFQATAVVIGAS